MDDNHAKQYSRDLNSGSNEEAREKKQALSGPSGTGRVPCLPIELESPLPGKKLGKCLQIVQLVKLSWTKILPTI